MANDNLTELQKSIFEKDLCDYCKMNKTENEDHNVYIDLFKEFSRTNKLLSRRVEFEKIRISVNRCSKCKGLHENAKIKSWITLIVILLGTMNLMCYTSDNYNSVVTAFLSIYIMISLILIMIGEFSFKYYLPILILNKIFLKMKGIMTETSGAKKNKRVRELVNRGWSFRQPIA